MLEENIMSVFTDQIITCKLNGWDDLLLTVENLHQSLFANPEAVRQIAKELQEWSNEVNQRLSSLTPSETDLTEKNPVMSFDESFGAEI